ncbi:MAG TPA: shikimate dehydrogenase [Burkholderiales bacterium]|nr:shikimate dehydrogenase [Burkholderiales bacterium]
MPDRYAVIGNPVAHSKSPVIHAEFARQTGEDIEYVHLFAPLDGFVATVEAFRAAGGKGLNVTVPFKLEAFRYATAHTPRALDAQAVNILKFESDRVVGDNSDGVGLVRDIEQNLGFALRGKHVLLMGAGGAVQGVLGPLLDAEPAALAIANRTADKAIALAQRYRARAFSTPLTATGYAELAGQSFELVINGTSSSLGDAVPDLPDGVFGPGSLAYDMMYGKGLTPFLRRAQEQGASRVADGIGMLVEQAAESFLVWRGVRPRTMPVIQLLKGL